MFQQHEAKGQPTPKDEAVIVEAFGMRKCPKLIEQVMNSDSLTIRRNALAVLCDEMHNPLSVQGCVDAKMVVVLNSYIAKSDDPMTRERASRALALAAVDANGRRSMLEERSAEKIVPGIEDAEVAVRKNVYEALTNFCGGTLPCLKSVVLARYPSTLVKKAATEAPELQPLVLQLLHHCVRDEKGLDDALGAGAVNTCISLLESRDSAVRKEAATTLGFLCFAESAKLEAIAHNAVPLLCALLVDPSAAVQSATAGALMAITTTDEGKLAFVPAKGVDPLVALLLDPNADRILLLNVLKTVANVVVHPAARMVMRQEPRVLPVLGRLEVGKDPLVAKHAAIAKAAVLWEP
jgi:hypothetical protein